MTTWLSGWLRDIILIILVASFVDLLIPNNSLERYVKVVVSLIVLLTILSPVVSFLKEDKAVNQVLEQASIRQDQVQSLNSVLANGARMKRENDLNSTLLTEQQVGRMMKEKLESSLAVSLHEVLVSIVEEDGRGPSIQHVQVIFRSEKSFESVEKPLNTEKKSNIDQVSPVNVNIRLEDAATNSETETETEAVMKEQDVQGTTQQKLEQQVIAQIVEEWGMSENRIQVKWR